jgi:hypothetical protein
MGVVSKILANQARRAGGRIKKVFSAPPEKPPVYPLGLHQNAVIRFDPSDFILAAGDLKIALPEGDISVMAVGAFSCLGVSFHRFYLEDLQKTEWVLQVAESGQELDLILFQTIDEVYPDDWDFWLNESTGLIGYKDFHTPDQVEYYRVYANPGPDWSSPIEFEELIRGLGENYSISHAMMLYNRGIETAAGEELVEYLLVSREEDEDGVLVRIMAGVPVSPMSLTIL